VVSRPELDVHDAAAIERCISGIRPWAVINTTGYAGIDAAEQDAVNCYRTNVISAKNLAKTCARFDIQFVTFSTDLVFDGSQDRPYTEQDHVGPLCVYGHSKAAAERRVLRTYPQALVVRTSGLFGAYDARNYLSHSLRQIAAGEPVQAPADWTVSPTYLPDLVHRCLDLLIDGESGIWHITNDGACTWAELAATAARALGLDDRLVERCRGRDLGWLARRPRFSALASEQGIRLPSLDDALCRYRQAFERFNLARAKEDMIDGLAKAC
jgi:dTDP-4-dehydrorhamnose reductase